MASPAVTYTFVNGNVADASQVNQNFTDIINSLTDGTKSLNIDAITASGTATFNGNSTIGDTSGDSSTVNATMSFATTPKTDNIAEKTSSAGVTIDGVLCKDNTITASGGLIIGNETLDAYDTGTWSPSEITKSNLTGTASFGTATYTRIGNIVFARIETITGLTTVSTGQTYIEFGTTGLPGTSNGKHYYGCGYTTITGGSLTGSVIRSGSGSTYGVLIWQSQGSLQSQGLQGISFHYII